MPGIRNDVKGFKATVISVAVNKAQDIFGTTENSFIERI